MGNLKRKNYKEIWNFLKIKNPFNILYIIFNIIIIKLIIKYFK